MASNPVHLIAAQRHQRLRVLGMDAANTRIGKHTKSHKKQRLQPMTSGYKVVFSRRIYCKKNCMGMYINDLTALPSFIAGVHLGIVCITRTPSLAKPLSGISRLTFTMPMLPSSFISQPI